MFRDLDEVKKRSNELNKDNKELRDRVENIEKETRMRMLQRSVGHSHSRDSAIDTDLQVRLNHLPSSPESLSQLTPSQNSSFSFIIETFCFSR